jgi:hypothetical protein
VLSEQVRPLATSHQIEFAPPNSITAALGADQDCTQAAIELRCGNRYRVMLNRLAAKGKIFIFAPTAFSRCYSWVQSVFKRDRRRD